MSDKRIPEGTLIDAKGRHCPIDTIKPQLLLEDQTVNEIHRFAEDLSAQISRFKEHTFDDLDAFLDVLRKEYGSNRGGSKGNMEFKSFNGLRKVVVQVQERMNFGPELQIAKELIDECLVDWSEDTRSEIKAIITDAFNVDKAGQVSVERILRLRKFDFDDDRWKRAIQAITDSIRITGSKAYVRFYKRTSATDRWEPIVIALASA